ncbi:unnamed protein product [Gadus morhua 'NCC']
MAVICHVGVCIAPREIRGSRPGRVASLLGVGRVSPEVRASCGIQSQLPFHIRRRLCEVLCVKMSLARRLIGGFLDIVSNIDPAQFVPSEPPPPRRPLAYAEHNESEEDAKFRRVFKQLAGEDMEVSPKELMDILNKIISKHAALKTDGFSIESCRSMVAVMDSDSTGKLGFHEFKYLWNNIKKWQGVYLNFDQDGSGVISGEELPGAFTAAGFPLNDQLCQMIVRRYSDESGNLDFDNYIGCLVRLDAMCRAFKTLDKDNNGTIKVNVKEWLQLTMYS